MMINKATSPYLFLLLFFIFQFLPSLAFAEATTIDPHSKNIAIHTFGGGELLEKVFNAVSMLIYGNSTSGLGKTFHSIIRIALVIGGFSVACLAFFREKFEPIIRSFFLPSLGITSFLLVPRTDVLIQDHLIQKTRSTEFSALIKVENVPFFLGKFVTLVSTLSYQITDALEGVTHG
ncbi:MAG: conjugal transfer protein TraG N-terminal domain-containing protein, partial [Simkaniaceae bacterium]|nr:conjugal transfer protein TraG N-terminal domain-containing protein [Simkaniaceae bacterium]